LNELLDFVHHSHSSSPKLSPLILPFKILHAAWRFISDHYQLSKLREAHRIQDDSALKRNFPLKTRED
jgi:hypothetical protein